MKDKETGQQSHRRIAINRTSVRNHRSTHRSTGSENQGNQQEEEGGNNVGVVIQNSHDNQKHEGGDNNVRISNGDNDRPFFY